MQTAFSHTEYIIQPEKPHKTANFRVTSRDVDILEFVLEMKFSTIEDIHTKFFKFTKLGELSLSLRWARERVAILVKSGFLSTVKDVCPKTLYLVTPKGFFYLKNSRQENQYSRPLHSIDSRTYVHDQKVIQVRLQLEEIAMVKDWVSERQLSEIEEYRSTLPSEFRPDAIYTRNDGKKVAFELELSRKSKDRYQQKINRYVQLISEFQTRPLFELVHYVCEKETVLDLIQDQTALFQPYFKFNLVNEILK